MIDYKKVRNKKFVYVVSFYDGRIDGCKYSVEKINVSYSGFIATVGTKYFATFEAADNLAKRLNTQSLNEGDQK
ncbi:hypothetical protein [Sulfurimonas indica]|uniref:hypothetical protein n=1 Tax=Sulfurimonas indica TaxID=2508707 RepID=UPI00126562AD|nr:hypothetical protein [Sulfurimonas indica]